jgi:hypothetical protein
MVQATDITVVKMSVADAAGNHVGVLPWKHFKPSLIFYGMLW